MPKLYVCVMCGKEFPKAQMNTLYKSWDDPEKSWCQTCWDHENAKGMATVTYEDAQSAGISVGAPGLGMILGANTKVPVWHYLPRYLIPKSEWGDHNP